MSRLTESTYRGWRLLTLDNNQLAITIVPAKGGDIVSLRRIFDGLELLWSTPWGLRQHGALQAAGNARAQSLDGYPGGWQSLFPNAGDSVSTRGAEWGENGEATVAAYDWKMRPDHSLQLTTRLVRSPFAITKIISLDDNAVQLTETIHNDSPESLEVMWGQQLAFGAPVISKDTIFDCAASLVRPDAETSPEMTYQDLMPWPRTQETGTMINLHAIPGPDAGVTRQVYLSDLQAPVASLRNDRHNVRVELNWDADPWPHLWYLLEAGGERDFPWFGNGYFLILGPNSSWPAHGIHTARQVDDTTLWIDPGEQRTARLRLQVSATDQAAS